MEVINLPEESVPEPQPAKTTDDNLIAALCYVSIIGVIILFTRKGSDYLSFHAKQASVLAFSEVVLVIISLPLMVFLWPVIYLLWLVFLTASIVGFLKAYGGQRYKLPVVGDLAENINI